jgi:excisionase family DNA binding protein
VTKLLSTSAVARLLGVAPGSVINWIDQGQLKAGRTPGGHRRIARKDLVAFLRRQKLPIPPELGAASPKVLVVDDEASVTKWIAAEVRAEHPEYGVFEAQDGYAAGELVGSLKPDVVILDLRMPGLDGYEVCRRIKSNEDTKGTTVIAITAYLTPKAKKEILACGAQVCLAKPLDIRDLLQEIDRALS